MKTWLDFKNFKVWAQNENEEKEVLLPTSNEGEYKSSDGNITARLSTVSKENMTAIYVDAVKQRGHFHYKCAVGFTVENIPDLSRYLANYKRDSFWCRSEMGEALTELPKDTQGMIYEQKDGKYSLCLPVCDAVYNCSIFGDADGMNVALSSYYHALSKIEHSLALVLCTSEDTPYTLMQKSAEYAFELLGTGCHTRVHKRYPEILEYLGWCSWDVMQINVSEEGLLEKCQEFKEKGIPVKWAMIDDMWGDCRGLNERPYYKGEMIKHMYNCALTSFEADKERFPNGLKHCVEEIKKYGIQVGMWHPTTGYWNGIDPESELAKEFADCLMTVPNGKLVLKMEKEKVFKFYNAFHTFFRECGVSFVKVDNQSHLREHYKNVYPLGVAARELHAGLEGSVGANFDNSIINCMCMASENMWNRPTSSVARCSGDFQPENKAWFKKHMMMCIYNSLFQGEFYWSDFDMWWTDDGQKGKNSLMRAISGGPIYISDKIGRSNGEVLEPLVFDDGRILRCDRPAYPVVESMFNNPGETAVPLQICNTCSGGRYGVVVACNIYEKDSAVKGRISSDDILGLEGEEFAVYEYYTGKVRFLKRGECLDYTLKNNDDYRLYLISPFDENGIAMLGRIDKYMSGAAITDKFKNSYSIYEGGKIAFVNRGRRNMTAVCESGEYKVNRQGSLCTFECSREDKHFLLK